MKAFVGMLIILACMVIALSTFAWNASDVADDVQDSATDYDSSQG
jgi:hypothetical protein